MYRLQSYLPTAVLACLIFFFGFHALTGDRGLLGARQRAALLSDRQAQLVRLRDQRTELEVRAHLLRNQSLSADLLEERAHVLLGFVDPRDYVIRTRADPR
jgi:cell division protein FtsB